MKSEIAYLSELSSVLCNNEKTNEGDLHFYKTFKPGRFLKAFSSSKSKGVEVSSLLLCLLFFRLWGESINRVQDKMRNFLERVGDNTFYRLMDNPWMDWRKLLIGLAKQFKAHVKALLPLTFHYTGREGKRGLTGYPKKSQGYSLVKSGTVTLPATKGPWSWTRRRGK